MGNLFFVRVLTLYFFVPPVFNLVQFLHDCSSNFLLDAPRVYLSPSSNLHCSRLSHFAIVQPLRTQKVANS